ncbi:egalitarian protein homolog [Strongylocentrotus purpuratus]|uniref:3'-5' exonuclease domain-containing protein n=1 Tax=Strongylocentrotus purpuratus TaxID=7668 RepID=A0A7M7HJ99_STRPU|nr:egalitarian protein homolog [Strongylocentrotus purpuratus]
MNKEILSKVPQEYRKTVKKYCQWEVTFFRRDIEPAPQVSPFNVPERYFSDTDIFSGVPHEAVGRIISALLHITHRLNNISLQKLLPLVKSHFKVKKIPKIGSYLATEEDLEKFIVNSPQYFTISSRVVKRCCGFSDDVFNSAITQKALGIQFPSTTGTRRQTAAASSAGDPVDFQDVVSQTKIIDSLEDCKRILDPILDQSRRETVVIGLDCEGVKLGRAKGCLTLVQISTWDGKAFLFDAFKNPQLLKGNSSLKKILEHDSILKVIHACKSDTYSLYHGFGVKLKNVFDTSIAMFTIMEQLNRNHPYQIGYKALCELLGEAASHKDDDFKKKMIETEDFWEIRPLTEEMIYYAASDTLCLVPTVYLKLKGMLTRVWRDLFTWSCKNAMERKQRGKPRYQMTSGTKPNPNKGHREGPSLQNLRISNGDDIDDSHSIDDSPHSDYSDCSY